MHAVAEVWRNVLTTSATTIATVVNERSEKAKGNGKENRKIGKGKGEEKERDGKEDGRWRRGMLKELCKLPFSLSNTHTL